VDNVQLEVRSEVGHGQDALNSASLKGGGTRSQESRVGLERASWGRWGLGSLNIVTHGGSDRRNHLGVEHEGGRLICQFSHSLLNVLLAHSGELINLLNY
jgi:hypothetical protein